MSSFVTINKIIALIAAWLIVFSLYFYYNRLNRTNNQINKKNWSRTAFDLKCVITFLLFFASYLAISSKTIGLAGQAALWVMLILSSTATLIDLELGRVYRAISLLVFLASLVYGMTQHGIGRAMLSLFFGSILFVILWAGGKAFSRRKNHPNDAFAWGDVLMGVALAAALKPGCLLTYLVVFLAFSIIISFINCFVCHDKTWQTKQFVIPLVPALALAQIVVLIFQ